VKRFFLISDFIPFGLISNIRKFDIIGFIKFSIFIPIVFVCAGTYISVFIYISAITLILSVYALSHRYIDNPTYSLQEIKHWYCSELKLCIYHDVEIQDADN